MQQQIKLKKCTKLSLKNKTAVEFDEKTLYEGTNYYENFFYKGKTLGDPADMISYACIDAPKVRESNLTNEEKKKLIGNKKVSFANPEDTSNKKADDVYMNIERKENGLSFDLVGFGDFKDTEIFTFVFHTSNENGENWKIQNDDVTLMVSFFFQFTQLIVFNFI